MPPRYFSNKDVTRGYVWWPNLYRELEIMIPGYPLGQESQESQERSGISENLAKCQEKVRKMVIISTCQESLCGILWLC